MNERPDEVEQRLRTSLRRGADTLPYALDMTTGAVARARRIRRGRRVATGAAALAVVAVAVPVGLQATDSQRAGEPPTSPATQEGDGPRKVDLDLATMSAGARPAVPFAQNGVFFLAGDAGSVDLQSLSSFDAVAWGDVAAVTESYDDGREQRLYVYDPTSDMQTRDVLVEEGAVSTVASADHRWLAYVDAGEGEAVGTVTVADADTGASEGFELVDRSTELLAVADGTVFWQSGGGGETPTLQAWSAAGGPIDIGIIDATAVSGDGTVASAVTERPADGSCHGLFEVPDGEQQWRTCDWTPESISPGGRWVYAEPASTDGYGPVEVAVLDAYTGEVVRTVRFGTGEDVGFFRDAEWESADTLLLQVEAASQAALVRVDVGTGEASTAMPPVPYAGLDAADPEPPPYQLG